MGNRDMESSKNDYEKCHLHTNTWVSIASKGTPIKTSAELAQTL